MEKLILSFYILAITLTPSIETDGFAAVLPTQELTELIEKSLESNAELRALQFELAEEQARIKPAGSQ